MYNYGWLFVERVLPIALCVFVERRKCLKIYVLDVVYIKRYMLCARRRNIYWIFFTLLNKHCAAYFSFDDRTRLLQLKRNVIDTENLETKHKKKWKRRRRNICMVLRIYTSPVWSDSLWLFSIWFNKWLITQCTEMRAISRPPWRIIWIFFVCVFPSTRGVRAHALALTWHKWMHFTRNRTPE